MMPLRHGISDYAPYGPNILFTISVLYIGVGVAAALVLVIIINVLCCVICCRRRKRNAASSGVANPGFAHGGLRDARQHMANGKSMAKNNTYQSHEQIRGNDQHMGQRSGQVQKPNKHMSRGSKDQGRGGQARVIPHIKEPKYEQKQKDQKTRNGKDVSPRSGRQGNGKSASGSPLPSTPRNMENRYEQPRNPAYLTPVPHYDYLLPPGRQSPGGHRDGSPRSQRSESTGSHLGGSPRNHRSQSPGGHPAGSPGNRRDGLSGIQSGASDIYNPKSTQGEYEEIPEYDVVGVTPASNRPSSAPRHQSASHNSPTQIGSPSGAGGRNLENNHTYLELLSG